MAKQDSNFLFYCMDFYIVFIPKTRTNIIIDTFLLRTLVFTESINCVSTKNNFLLQNIFARTSHGQNESGICRKRMLFCHSYMIVLCKDVSLNPDHMRYQCASNLYAKTNKLSAVMVVAYVSTGCA